MQVGDTKDLELKFPEDYHSTDLAGKDVVFTVTVNSISRVPELTDEVADSVVEGMTAEAYQESVRQDLEDQAKESQKTEAEQKLLQAVYENATIDGYPEENLQYTIKRAKDYYEWLASMYGMSLDDYLKNYGMTQDEFNEQIQPVAEEALGEEMTLLAIAKRRTSKYLMKNTKPDWQDMQKHRVWTIHPSWKKHMVRTISRTVCFRKRFWNSYMRMHRSKK